MAIALRMLVTQSPGMRLIVSFADSEQGHHGGIYQATNWLYLGSKEYHAYRVNGAIVHPKTLHSRYGKGGQSVPWLRRHIDPSAERIRNGKKHKYVMPMDAVMRLKLLPLSKSYPKRTKEQDAGYPPALGGVTPTRALQIEVKGERQETDTHALETVSG